MAVQPQDSFRRTFPLSEWYAGVGRGALAWSILHGALWCLLLLQLGLFLGLLVDRGGLSLTLSPEENSHFERLTGLKHVAAPLGAAAAPKPDAPVDAENPESARVALADAVVVRTFDDAGILPSVWRARDAWWGGLLAAAYRTFPTLRQNSSALVVLLTAAAVTWLVRMWTVAQLRMRCRLAASEVARRLRQHLHRQALRLGAEDLDGSELAGAKSLITEEADRVRVGVFQWLYCGARYPWEAAFLVLAAGSVEWLLTAQWTLFALVGWYVIARAQQQVERTRRLAEDRAQTELKFLADDLGHARLVRGYGMDDANQQQFQAHMDRYLSQLLVLDRIQDNPLWLRLVSSLAGAAIAAFLLWLLGMKTLLGFITLPAAGVFLAAFGLGMNAAAHWRRLPALRSEVAIAVDRIWRYLDRLPTVSQAVGAKFLQPLAKTLHVERVTYRDPHDRLLIDRLDVQLAGGRSYALLSLDPLEPKAFAYLLPRFIEPQSGRILFDGEDIAWGTLESLRAETIYVSADDPMLPGTVMDNILAGRTDVTLPQATDAAKEARAHNFISRLPQGYETSLDGRADPLDAGQRFRLALARALLRKPSVLIIEEPEAPLDEDTKQLLDDTYNRICQGRTVFFLPRRLSTVRRCDDILFFQNGTIEAYGPHALLVKESPLYRHWEYINFNEFRRE